ncbi:MAG: DNA/RNA non-specific endonuclease [Byssovorax sp.]
MSRSSNSLRRLRNGAIGLVVLAAGFAACRPDCLLETPGSGQGQGPTSSPAPDKRGHGRRHDPSREPPADSAAPPPTTAGQGTSGSVHLALGAPVRAVTTDDYLMIKPQYALSYSRERNVANWVSSNLDASYFGPAPRHKGKFLSDSSLPSGFYQVQDRDYSGSGYDRGHMVRSEERTRTPEDNLATFLLPNVLPQRHDLNAGPWLRLEDYLQALSQKENKELYVTAGGLFSARPETIGHGVSVPESCFKIVVVLDRGQGLSDVSATTRVIAVIMPNLTGLLDEPWGHYRTTVSEIEKRSGYTFFPLVPEPVRRALVARVDSGAVH